MTSILLLGFVIGLYHVLEADHVAAVSALVCGRSDIRRIANHGAIWGLGHTLALLLVGGGAVLLKAALDPAFTNRIELFVGIMMVGLGGHLLYRLRRDRIHLHTHRHADGTVHFHAHSHGGDDAAHGVSRHDHVHSRASWVRTLLVGLVQGMAGSAALLVLGAAALDTPVTGLVFILLFGLGSIAGMTALSVVIAFPLTFTARRLTGANTALQSVVGLATVAVGCLIIGETLPEVIRA